MNKMYLARNGFIEMFYDSLKRIGQKNRVKCANSMLLEKVKHTCWKLHLTFFPLELFLIRLAPGMCYVKKKCYYTQREDVLSRRWIG